MRRGTSPLRRLCSAPPVAAVKRCLSTELPYGEQSPELSYINRGPRYASGPSTFFRLPHVLFEPSQRGINLNDDEAVVGIVGVPYDGGATNRAGARHGPRGVREASCDHVRAYNQSTNMSPFEIKNVKVRDFGDCVVQAPWSLESSHAEIHDFYSQLLTSGVIPLSVGGDHSITLPILKAFHSSHAKTKGKKLSLIHIDAHADTGDKYLGSRFHHGAPFRVAVQEGFIDPIRTIQIGIRGSLADPKQWQFSYENGMTVIPMDHIHSNVRYVKNEAQSYSIDDIVAEIKRVVGDGPDDCAYVSFDIDVLDPAYAPGTGTPEIGGLTTREAQQLIRGIGDLDLNIVGCDLVEVSPPFDAAGVTSLAGANLLFELLCILAKSSRRR